MFRFLQFVLLMTFAVAAGAQNIDSTLTLYYQTALEEKTYVHFDKEIYNEGETVWFKAYLLNHTWPSDISKNFYAELIDDAGKVVQRKILPVYEASAAGNFDLPQRANGNYIFRGYTTWMLNFDTAFLFTKTIVVNKTTGAAAAPLPTVVRFFPEGGHAVQGLSNVIAFKGSTTTGYPVTVNGEVRDEAGAVVTLFSSRHNGMGVFNLTPAAGKTYTAYWQDEKGAKGSTSLPATLPQGVTLQATPAQAAQTVVVSRSNNVGPELQKLHLYVQMHQQTVYKAHINLTNRQQISLRIPTAQLPSGIMQITVFNEVWQPLAERIVFVKNGTDFFTPTINAVQKNVTKRGKNVLEIEVPDTLKANLSLAITDAPLTATTFAPTIISGLLLTPDLRGYVHQPGYYFSSNNDTVQQHLDLLMLTQGWRRYNWADIVAGKAPQITHKPENYLSLRGRVEGVKPVPGGTELNLILQAKDSGLQFFNVPVAANGDFAAEGLIFFDTIQLRYQFNKNKALNSRATVNFTPGYFKGTRYINNETYPVYTPSFFTNTVLQRNAFFGAEANNVKPLLDKKLKVLENVVVRTRLKSKQEEMDRRYTNGMFNTPDALSFDLTDPLAGLGYMDILQYLQGRVPGLQIQLGMSMGDASLTWRGSPTALFLNEMQVEPEQIRSIPVSDIAYVKAMRPPFFGAPMGGAGGAIAIYTKRGGEGASRLPGLEKGQVIGYSSGREFYSPDYATSSPLHEVTDVRSTLLWRPFILTDKTSRKVRIEFYNNDLSQQLRVVLEGINAEGRIARIEQVLQ